MHSISSRVKGESSVLRKMLHSQQKYSTLSDIHDISGSRIITYFEDEVKDTAKVIEEEFEIDKSRSVDKGALLDPEQFGYISLHYVCKWKKSRLDLSENHRFQGLLVEIQIRSILQHTWAEIEHDLGYRSEAALPKEVRRRFSRLAGLLELADAEFSRLRDEVNTYEQQVQVQVGKRQS